MSQQVGVLRNNKIFLSICTLVLVILGVWWASSSLFGGVLKSMLTLNEAIIDVKEG